MGWHITARSRANDRRLRDVVGSLAGGAVSVVNICHSELERVGNTPRSLVRQSDLGPFESPNARRTQTGAKAQLRLGQANQDPQIGQSRTARAGTDQGCHWHTKCSGGLRQIVGLGCSGSSLPRPNSAQSNLGFAGEPSQAPLLGLARSRQGFAVKTAHAALRHTFAPYTTTHLPKVLAARHSVRAYCARTLCDFDRPVTQKRRPK